MQVYLLIVYSRCIEKWIILQLLQFFANLNIVGQKLQNPENVRIRKTKIHYVNLFTEKLIIYNFCKFLPKQHCRKKRQNFENVWILQKALRILKLIV